MMKNEIYRNLVEDFIRQGTDWDYARVDTIADNYDWDDDKKKVVVGSKTVVGQVGEYNEHGLVSNYKDFEIEIYNLKLSKSKFKTLLAMAYREEIITQGSNFEKLDSEVYFDFK